MKIPTVKANGAEIPCLGFGTWQLRGAEGMRAMQTALEVGYRHFDTAQAYENEHEVGEVLNGSGLARKDLFVTTKVRREKIADGVLQKTAEESLKQLGMDYVDLLLIHWPNPDVPLKESMKALAETKKRGLTRHIGVSNFTVALLDQAVAACDEKLVNNQVEYHPFLDESKVIAACRKHGLSVTAYCPLARGRVFESDVLKEIAKAKGRTISQIVTRWLIQQKDVIAIPRTVKPERVKENFQVFDFTLSPQEMERISGLSKGKAGRVVSVAWAPVWD